MRYKKVESMKPAVGTFRTGEFMSSICSPPFDVFEESYHCHCNACKHSNPKKKQPMLYEHMEKQRDAVQSANIFPYYKNEANVLAAVKQGIVKLD
jgi:hypothetical protein